MASTGKKGKKFKFSKVNAQEFFQGTPIVTVKKTTSSWAEEAAEEFDLLAKVKQVILPTAPKASRTLADSDAIVPKNPPYIAHISNLPFDVVLEDVEDYFAGLNISNISLPRDDRDPGRVRGFGYVEFEDRNSLMEALLLPDVPLKGRSIRIELSSDRDNKRRGRDRDDRGGRMGSGNEAPDGDWRSGSRNIDQDDGGRKPFSRDRYERNEEESRPGAWRDNKTDGARSSAFSDRGDRDRDGGGRFGNRDGGRFRRDYNRDEIPEEKEPLKERPRLNLQPRTKALDDLPKAPTATSTENLAQDDDTRSRRSEPRAERESRTESRTEPQSWRDNARKFVDDEPAAPPKDEPKPEPEPERPKTRPKLLLAPRTKPIDVAIVKSDDVDRKDDAEKVDGNEEEKRDENGEKFVKPAAPVSAASIFGGARPVDTTAREREIEEKLAKERGYVPKTTSRDSSRARSNDNEDANSRSGDDRPDERSDNYYPKRSDDSRRNDDRHTRSRDYERRGSPDSRRLSPRNDRRSPGRYDRSRNDRRDNRRDDRGYDRPRDYDSDRRYNDRRRDDRRDDRRDERRGDRRDDRKDDRRDERRDDHKSDNRGAGRDKPYRAPERSRVDDDEEEVVDINRLPKLKEKEVPNFAASNKYAFLDNEDASD